VPRARPAGSRPLLARPYLGTALAVFLLALVVSPMLWMNSNRPHTPAEQAMKAAAPSQQAFDLAEAPPAQPEQAPVARQAEPPAVVAPPPASPPPPPAASADAIAPVAPSSPAPLATNTARAGRAEEAGMEAPSALSMAAPAEPAPLAKAAAPRARNADERREIVVTSSRRDASRLEGRGYWNACTVDDPQPKLSACKQVVNPAAKGQSGVAAARLADGLNHAWRGNPDAAIADFDKAIAIVPKSSFAYLNRGLAHRLRGDQDQALADLDKAVRYAPHDARIYYHRSLLLHERGDAKRAEADRQRAISLDGRYELRP
jgi:Flp pilus assembly protein TadD